jgi:hypothetical protein
MKRTRLSILALVILTVGLVSCYQPAGYHFYPGVPRLTPTNPANVELLRHEPKREHIRLGEVWMQPDPGMSRAYVEGTLAEKAAQMGADALVIVVDKYFREGVVFNYWSGPVPYVERRIVGVAISYRR